MSTTQAGASTQEAQQLDRLYRNALAEGGQLVVYGGGDSPGGLDDMGKAFEDRFPGVSIHIVTDLSKFHDARIDNQIARNRLVVDVAHLQTLHDFTYWKRRGDLLRYVPEIGWRHVPPGLKDQQGYYTGIGVLSLGNVVNADVAPHGFTPTTALDFLDTRLKGKMVLAYPSDDDAILFIFKQFVDRHGWEFMDRFMAQEPTFIRGTEQAGADVAAGRYAASPGAWWPLTPSSDGSGTRFMPFTQEPFMTWPQTAAIFRKAPHPETAKLYLNWLLSEEVQGSSLTPQWPIRSDVQPASGQPSVYKLNTDPTAFGRFMADRDAVERLKAQFILYTGEPKGENPTEVHGTNP
ncbi:ABC transporter substrate-binding protein [Dyella sp.]|uniref:ABC transporter substrate-binding protein n=1 Tax=Dyella sp. TaxID=1869338 RepID=UPI002ED4F715